MSEPIHVAPIPPEHKPTTTCWCMPILEREAISGVVWLVIHRPEQPLQDPRGTGVPWL